MERNSKEMSTPDAISPEQRHSEVVEDKAIESEGKIINYRTLNWWDGGLVLMAETVSLGILSLPSVLAQLGFVTGVIVILVMSVLSTYSLVVLGDFQKAHPEVKNFGDAVALIGKSIGMERVFQEVFGWAQVIFQVMVAASHILTWTICLNTLTDGSTCTIVWAVVGLGVFWACNWPRTLKYTRFMSMLSCGSITVATLMTVGDVAANKPIGSGSLAITRQLGFSSAFLSVSNVAVSFASHSCFFSVIDEFKKPEDWPKALALLQIADTVLYLIAAIVIYVYVGVDVPSPALSAATSPLMRKIIWGIAIPTIVIAGVIYGHVAAEYIFARIFRGTKHIHTRTFFSTSAWLGLTFGMWLFSMIIAESIPIFNNLLGLVAALFVSWFSYGLPGIFSLWMHKGHWFDSKAQKARFFSNVILLITAVLLCTLGLWASVDAIAKEEVTKPWTCKSNAAVPKPKTNGTEPVQPVP